MNVTELKEYNRKIIIENAIECLLERGIQNTSVGLIAKKSGLNIRTVTRNFGSKENIVSMAAISYVGKSAEWMRSVMDVDKIKNRNGLEKILYLLQAKADLLRTEPNKIAFINELENLFNEEGNQEELITQYFQAVDIHKQTMRRLYREGLEDGSITKEVKEERAILLLTGVYKGLLQRLAVVYRNRKVAEYTDAEEEIEIFIDMVKKYLGNGI